MVIDAAEPQLAQVLLDENRERLLRQLRATLNRYEARYEMPSSAIHEALEDGRLQDTAEVCDWVIAWEAYLALSPTGSPRLE